MTLKHNGVSLSYYSGFFFLRLLAMGQVSGAAEPYYCVTMAPTERGSSIWHRCIASDNVLLAI